METVQKRKLTEELKLNVCFILMKILNFAVPRDKNQFCKTLILTMFIEQLHVFSVVDFSRK